MNCGKENIARTCQSVAIARKSKKLSATSKRIAALYTYILVLCRQQVWLVGKLVGEIMKGTRSHAVDIIVSLLTVMELQFHFELENKAKKYELNNLRVGYQTEGKPTKGRQIYAYVSCLYLQIVISCVMLSYLTKF